MPTSEISYFGMSFIQPGIGDVQLAVKACSLPLKAIPGSFSFIPKRLNPDTASETQYMCAQ